ncbi:MAG: neutral/alkaline non-lysosomal ceramidase N-terminal domain-containing protein [Deltaproteobacteria bacterium]|nr:neutral/alkaline non-lysosomal ceramidase N-terminal domain-containing protein [Deltaproteobacteria bacterium]
MLAPAAVLACTTIEGTLPAPVSRAPTSTSATTTPTTPTAATGWLAGAAEIDITPPPGYPMAGHSLESVVGLGVWTRLRAQAIYVEDAAGTPLVLVVCDQWAIEPGLVDRVAERLADHPGLEHVGREHLIIAATHTHHGPGQTSSARVYSAYASSEHGHDPGAFEALANRIATAVAEAAAGRQPARIDRRTTAVPALSRNRSVAAMLHDPEAQTLLRANAGLPGCLEAAGGTAPDVDPCHAVDPVLETLHFVDTRNDHTIAVAGVFAMHPTGMPNKTEVYHADVFGLASVRAQAVLASRGGQPVVALFNGAQGDVSPHWAPQGRPSTAALGQSLGEALVATLDQPGQPVEGTITVGYGWRPIANQRWTDAEGQPRATARRAVSGKGQFGGAEDGRTRLYDKGWREGRRRKTPRRNGQGHKRNAVPWPASMFIPPRGITPREVPLGVAWLADVPIVTLPGEVTTVLGLRVARAIADARPDAAPSIRLGLAGAYLGYFTTPQEYALQHYEGASMQYGEDSGSLVARHLAQMAADPQVERPAEFRHRPGRRYRWSMDRARVRSLDGIEQRLSVQLDTGPLAGLPRFHLWDTPPRWPTLDPHARVTPRVQVQAWTDAEGWHTFAPGGVPVDDRSGALASLLTHARDDSWRWGFWWLEPGAPPQQPLRFLVRTVGQGPVCSETFTTGDWFRPAGPGWLEPRDCALAPEDSR